MSDVMMQPMATYRLQFNQDFRFSDARALVPFFSRLGVTHVYASPILRARQESAHGYDVVDPKTLNSSLGDKTDLVDLVTDLHNVGLGLLLDIVPNHTAASIENPYWRDVLTYGHSSPFAGWFDIDWRIPDPDMWGRVLVPVLGEPRARVLAQDQIRIIWSDGRFLVQYFDNVFPVDPATVPTICEFGLESLKECVSSDNATLDHIVAILASLKKLPRLAARLRRRVDIDREETEQWLGQLARLVIQSPRIQQWAEDTAERFGQGEDGRRRLKKLLDSQPYRLVHWREAARTINYRRFFDINELVSVRQEDPQVFNETHSTVLRWVDDGLIDGLRIDHIDGLRDPLGYLERLAEALSTSERVSRPIPLFVEKILASDEKLPCGWPVVGTTGYEFLNQVERLFVSPEGFAAIENQYRRMLRQPVFFQKVATWGKRRVLRNELSPQVGRLADALLRLVDEGRQTSSLSAENEESVLLAEHAGSGKHDLADSTTADERAADGPAVATAALLGQPELTKRDVVDAIVEVITALPVYRTYVDAHDCTINDADRGYIEKALHEARGSGRAAAGAIDALGGVLLLEGKSQLPTHELHERVNFIERFQQLTGPAAAKGIEDTALYAYVPLVSLNEVGGEPHLPENPVATLHQANEDRAATWPQTMLAVTTHDTKRTADVRARLDVVSEVPKLWSGLVQRWRRLNRPHRARVRGKHAPDAVTEYLFYQTAIGIWPLPDPSEPSQLPASEVLAELRERIEEYMLKAVREAKTHTSWTKNDQEYEDAVVAFVRSLFLPDGDGGMRFLSEIQNLVARISRPGLWNSLSRTLIQFTAPGTPDLYQGDELWNFALVDPDNRRPVDYERRRQLLDEVIMGVEGTDEARPEFLRGLSESPEDGRIKLLVIRGALSARGTHPRLFAAGHYLPLATEGSSKDNLFAFARVRSSDNGSGEQAAIVVVPRLTATLVSAMQSPVGEGVWQDTIIQLPEQLQNRHWTCALTREDLPVTNGQSLAARDVLRAIPVALLVSTE